MRDEWIGVFFHGYDHLGVVPRARALRKTTSEDSRDDPESSWHDHLCYSTTKDFRYGGIMIPNSIKILGSHVLVSTLDKYSIWPNRRPFDQPKT